MDGRSEARAGRRPRRGLRRWAKSTSRQTFVLLPLAIAAVEAALEGGWPQVDLRWSPLLLWGYFQYELSGRYRTRHGGGGPGMDTPPTRIVDTGPYALTRNPMYLGHMIFVAGLALVFHSWIAAAVLVVRIPWFHARALEDERRLEPLFGDAFRDYRARVRRWIPFVI